MNPFENSMVSAKGLHAVMTKEIALKKERLVQGEVYPFFYNPLWNHFGDSRGNTPGTYYYSHSGHLNFFWNIFDQVLLRPGVLPYFDNESLKILDHDGSISFLRNGKPDHSIASDHLPILFQLNL